MVVHAMLPSSPSTGPQKSLDGLRQIGSGSRNYISLTELPSFVNYSNFFFSFTSSELGPGVILWVRLTFRLFDSQSGYNRSADRNTGLV